MDEKPDRNGLWIALVGFVGIRALVVLTAVLSAPEPEARDRDHWWSDVPLARWDSAYYLEIVNEGYRSGTEIPATVEFFPLYPLAGRVLAGIVSPELSLVIVANVCSVLGAVFFFLWCQRLLGFRPALIACMLLAGYPPSFFLSAAYAEGMLFLETSLALWLCARGNLVSAAGICAAATATRPTGIALAFVVWLFAAIQWRKKRASALGLRIVLLGVFSLSGFLAYQGYLWNRYGQPGAFFGAQVHWPKKEVDHPWLKMVLLQPVWEKSIRPIKCAFRGEFEKLLEPWTWNAFFVLIILVASVAGMIRPDKIPRLLFLLPIGIFLMGYVPDLGGLARFNAMSRYLVLALPSFLLIAAWRPLTRRAGFVFAIVIGQVALQCVFAHSFANWGWTG